MNKMDSIHREQINWCWVYFIENINAFDLVTIEIGMEWKTNDLYRIELFRDWNLW